ncbi:hypothetical protein KL911_000081 [Ogataea haglerorum]|uniref:uncharacterized protein n=1 Tax=Ogataea haglerorum TaxID=1937702 RepID=UPI001C8A4851|nr:uncharacterized protein KL911_000081 [Ogataea haglerorum]KAG7758944.1 hypothetical protein KL911_000081 [Ogataea haglerorum]
MTLSRKPIFGISSRPDPSTLPHAGAQRTARVGTRPRTRASTVSATQPPCRAETVQGSKQRSQSVPNFDVTDLMDALVFLEPTPVFPPSYSTLAPGKPKPVYSNPDEGHEPLPDYLPTVYKITTLSRKLEWISPYELAPQRQWRSVIVELNSTQLNIYNRDAAPRPAGCVSADDERLYKSRLTTSHDLRDKALFAQQGLLAPDNLVRSYSLQYAKVGIATDYKKKKHTLRLRAETEQFLLEFPTVESMIEWYCCLNLGIDNSLDLTRREMPKYRTVPRRRRRNRHPGDSLMVGCRRRPSLGMFRRRTSSADLSSLVSRWKRKFSMAGSRPAEVRHDEPYVVFSDVSDHEPLSLESPANESADEAEPDDESDHLDATFEDDGDDGGSPTTEEYEYTQHARHSSDATLVTLLSASSAEAEAEAMPEPTPVLSTPSSLSNGLSSSPTLQQRATPSTSVSSSSLSALPEKEVRLQYKWGTDLRLPSRRKILRDSIRCMTTLTANERWAGKYVVRDAASMDLALKSGGASFYSPDYTIPHQQVGRYFAGGRVGAAMRRPQGLERRLQEYVVSPCGLIPRINEGSQP